MANKILIFISSSTILLLFVSLQVLPPMLLKYQSEIDKLKLSIACPDKGVPLEENIEVYRVAFDPVTHPDSFLPNVLFDHKYNFPYDYSSNNKNETAKCARCGASFLKKYKKAKTILEHFSKRNKGAIGYSCIAKGILDSNDGLVKNSESDHLTLYEFDKIEPLSKKFTKCTEEE